MLTGACFEAVDWCRLRMCNVTCWSLIAAARKSGAALYPLLLSWTVHCTLCLRGYESNHWKSFPKHLEKPSSPFHGYYVQVSRSFHCNKNHNLCYKVEQEQEKTNMMLDIIDEFCYKSEWHSMGYIPSPRPYDSICVDLKNCTYKAKRQYCSCWCHSEGSH